MKKLPLILLIWLCAAANAQQLDFKGIRMGTSLGDLSAAPGLESLKCDDPDEEGHVTCHTFQTSITYADQAVRYFSARFINGRLAEASVETPGGSGQIVEDALRSKYGKPSAKKRIPQALKNGAPYKLAVTEWILPGRGRVAIEDNPAPVNQVFVSVSSQEFVNWQKNAQKATAKAKRDI